MLTFISGGVRSGKSTLGETLAQRFATARKVYLATLKPYDEEMLKRIEKHTFDRKDKNFYTIEKHMDIIEAQPLLKSDDTVLLDCLTALLSNELYNELERKVDKKFANEVKQKIIKSIIKINESVSNLIIISNDIFSDGLSYDESIEHYITLLGELHQEIAKVADNVIECVSGNILIYKGDMKV